MTADHVLERAAPDPDAIGRYADGATGVVDLYLPASTPRAAAILLHGGFWRAAYDRGHLRCLAAALAAGGVAVALPEYRRVGDPGGGVPGTIDDADAILREVPALLGARPADVAVVGHSAGGHLAVLAAGRASQPPRRVVSLAGVLDVAAAHAARLSAGAVAALLGEEQPDAERVAGIDPLVLPLPASEITLLHGVADADVPVEYSVAYAARHPRIVLQVIDDADHYDLIDPLSPAFARVSAAI